ncbi:type VI secretion system-associated protein TagF [Massilia sp. LjRoot122]|uniref:type VI secretion system-associated protein TagF n=1 Tax=Massilia sp. LjRoot122 TaxID=3342257 RepID=UPI003ECE2605
MEDSCLVPGFFGKLPSRGDFIGRRLPPDVRERMDKWIQKGLLQARNELGTEWLPVWLCSPIWRFVAGAGLFGAYAWAGVILPSHDRTGRCFPLVLAMHVEGVPSVDEAVTYGEGWFSQLEELALATLEGRLEMDSFDAALKKLVFEPPRSGRSIPAAEDSTEHANSRGSRSMWWSGGSQHIAPSLACCQGLPSAAAFVSLLDGRWEERGWRHANVDERTTPGFQLWTS